MVELLKGRLVVCPHSVSPRYKEIYKTMLLMKDVGITEGDLKQVQRSYKLREVFDALLGSKGIATHNLTNRNMNTILKHYVGFYNVDVALWYDSGLVHSWFLDNVVRSKSDENLVFQRVTKRDLITLYATCEAALADDLKLVDKLFRVRSSYSDSYGSTEGRVRKEIEATCLMVKEALKEISFTDEVVFYVTEEIK